MAAPGDNLALPLLFTAAGAVLLNAFIRSYLQQRKLASIPSIGPSGMLTSYLGVWRSIFHTSEMVQEGYQKYHGAAFRIPYLNRWIVILSGRQMIEELGAASVDDISLDEEVMEMLHGKELFDAKLFMDPYQAAIIRTPLTRSIKDSFPILHEEVLSGFAAFLPRKDQQDWQTFSIGDSVRRIVSRAGNRLFIGLPLCHDPEYEELNINITTDFVQSGLLLDITPTFLAPIVTALFSNMHKNVSRATEILRPLLQDRLDKDELYGRSWEGRPHDLVSWLLNVAEGPQRTVEDLAKRLLFVSFGAIHTTAMVFTVTTFYLAAYPEHIETLREEINEVVRAEGWSKAGMWKMKKLDSFIKESMRLAVGAYGMPRRTKKDFTFSNGVKIPAGTSIGITTLPMHSDESIYPDPHVFKWDRFLNSGDKTDEGAKLNQQLVTPNVYYGLFGFGKHACPGRFFAVNSIKLTLSELILNYDIKFKDGRRTPPPVQFFLNFPMLDEKSNPVVVKPRVVEK